VDPRPPFREEFRDRPRGIAWLEQLDVDVAERQAHDRGPVGGLGGPRREAEDVAIERQGLGDAGHRDTHVGDAGTGVGHMAVNLTVKRDGVEGFMAAGHPAAVSDATFAQEVEQHRGLAIVDFWATWCGPCHMVAPILEQLAGEYNGKVKVVKLDVDANQQTAMRFNVRSIPSILFFKDGRHVDTLVGAYPKPAFVQKIQQHLA